MTGDADSHDTRESDIDAERGFRFLRAGFTRLTALEERIAALDVKEKSSLMGDRAATSYNPLPDQLVALLGTATDHLRAIQVTVEDSGGKIMAMSLFTLVRSAYEATGTGLWLLEPARRDTRVLRSLALTWDNRRSVRTVMVALGQRMEDDQGFVYMERRIGEMIDARNGIRGLRIGRNTNPNKGTVSLDSVTDRLEAIGVSLPDLVFSPLVLWQMTSGIAHGNSAMMRNVLEKRQLGTFVDGSAAFELTTSIVALAMFYSAALDMVAQLLDDYDSRNQPLGPSV